MKEMYEAEGAVVTEDGAMNILGTLAVLLLVATRRR